MTLRLNKAFAAVKEFIQKAHENSTKYYDRRYKGYNPDKIQDGSMILLKNDRNISEIGNSWPTKYIDLNRVLGK